MSDITSKTAERSPYILVCFQECERMNMLIYEIRRSLKELDLGLKVPHLLSGSPMITKRISIFDITVILYCKYTETVSVMFILVRMSLNSIVS